MRLTQGVESWIRQTHFFLVFLKGYVILSHFVNVSRFVVKNKKKEKRKRGYHNITITFICMTIIIYSVAKDTLKQEQQEKEIIIMILITDNQVTSFLDDRILARKLFNNEI